MEHGLPSPDGSAPSGSKARPTSSTSGRDRKRASHQVTSSSRDRENQDPQASSQPHLAPTYRDVYAHPAAVQYLAQHPKRTIPKFGPYLLLQTLGEGEFGKVKLGLHGQWGEEVAVKLIRRAGVDGTVRMSKVEREIEVLRTLRHPNIVHLYDVIETDKYIGIIIEYASGGELFDHILAHKYLKEKDACKLFAQLISGVWYIHSKKIVHRDLKLENLLLDRNRNVIITDFGFANRFEHRPDDLMQTSCGSPCYAAPELVISEGLYVGSAVDIWSCGVILYAMLAGYLPFDDDPENPDGDNINLLYKYIINTPLTFPEYVSQGARDLLGLMLVPDPSKRADLRTIMLHSWLEPYRYLFERSVKDLEAMAVEQQRMKRVQYQKQMIRNAREVHGGVSEKSMRSQSAAIRGTGPEAYDTSFQPSSSLYDARPSASGSGAAREAMPPSSTSKKGTMTVEAVSEGVERSGADDSLFSSPPRAQVNQKTPGSSHSQKDQSSTPSSRPRTKESHDSTKSRSKRTPSRHDGAGPSADESGLYIKSTTDTVRSQKGMRHTIQVEYPGDPAPDLAELSISQSPPRSNQVNDDPFLSVNTGLGSGLNNMIEISESMPSTPLEANMNTDRRPQASSPPPPERDTPKRTAPTPVISISPSTPAKPVSGAAQGMGSATSPSKQPPVHMNGTGSPASAQSSAAYAKSIEGLAEQIQAITIPDHPSSDDEKANGAQQPQEASSPTASATASVGSGSSKGKGRHIRGISIDKISFRRPGSSSGKDTLSVNHQSRRQAASESAPSSTYTNSMVSSVTPSAYSSDIGVSATEEEKDTVKGKDAKSRRRKTLSIMIDPIKNRTIKAIKSRSVTVDVKTPTNSTQEVTPATPAPPPARSRKPSTPATLLPAIPRPPATPRLSASTSKAQKVMQWFRGGKQRVPSDASTPEVIVPMESDYSGPPPSNFQIGTAMESTSTVNRMEAPPVVITPASPEKGKRINPITWFPGRSISGSATTTRGGRQPPTPPKPIPYDPALIRIHHGAVDVGTVASGSPPELFQHVTQVLVTMGVEIQQETEFKYRCIRPKKRRDGQNFGLGLREPGASSVSAFNMSGSAAMNGVDQRGLPTSGSTSILRSILRRNSSRTGGSTMPADNENTLSAGEFSPEPSSPLVNSPSYDPIYGDKSADQGDEVRFSVELTRIDRLDDTFSLDIRRLKGNLRSYKFLYDTLKARCNFKA